MASPLPPRTMPSGWSRVRPFWTASTKYSEVNERNARSHFLTWCVVPRSLRTAIGAPGGRSAGSMALRASLNAQLASATSGYLSLQQSDDAAIRAQHLTVDPGPVGPGQERDHVCDVVRPAEPFQRRQLGHLLNQLLRLAVEKQRRSGGPGGDRVHRDVASPELLGHDTRHSLHAGLGCRIGGVARLIKPDDAGGESDDPPAFAQPPRPLTESVEAALQINGDLAVEHCVVGVGQRSYRHYSSIAHDRVDNSDRGLSNIEHPDHGAGIGHICL